VVAVRDVVPSAPYAVPLSVAAITVVEVARPKYGVEVKVVVYAECVTFAVLVTVFDNNPPPVTVTEAVSATEFRTLK